MPRKIHLYKQRALSRSGNGKEATRSTPGAFRRKLFIPPDPQSIPMKHRHTAAQGRAALREAIAAMRS